MKAVWWTLTVTLTLASFVVVALGVRQLDAPPPPAATPAPAVVPAPVAADSAQRRNEVMTFGREAAVRLLSYTPQNAERELTSAANELTTGAFQDEFTELIKTVIVPAATRQRVTTEAEVPAIAVETVDRSSASLLVFVNMRVTQGSEEPTNPTNSMRMTLENVDDSWLVTDFDPL